MKKLVRDRIPEIIRENGETPKFRVLDAAEFRNELLKKLEEEAAELRGAQGEEAFIAELADVEEVLRALYDAFGIDKDAVLAYAQKKRDVRGGFKERIFLEEVTR